MYSSNGNVCNGGKPTPKPTPTPTPSPSPSPSPSGSCATRDPTKQYDCYYEGCKTGDSASCTECCDGCHLESDPTKGTYCMEDKVLFTSDSCATRDPTKKYDCYYEGCKTGDSASCTECCDG